MSVHYSDDSRDEYGEDNTMMSEAAQEFVNKWDW